VAGRYRQTLSRHWRSCPGSAEVGSTGLGDLAQHADRLVGVVWDHFSKRSGWVLFSKVRVLLKEETPPVCNVGGVNGCFQRDPVEGTAKDDPECGYDLAERLLGKANAECLREPRGDLSDK
jgi:hypothetical protein